MKIISQISLQYKLIKFTEKKIIFINKFENTALFLRFGRPSKIIRHENEAFPKRSLNWSNLKTPAFPGSFACGRT